MLGHFLLFPSCLPPASPPPRGPAAPRIRYRCTKGELACSPRSLLLSHPRTMLAKSSIQANTKPKRSSSGFHSGDAFTTSHHRGRKITMELFSIGPSALPSLLLAGRFTLPPSPHPADEMPASKSNQSINHGLSVGSEVSLFREDDTREEGEEKKRPSYKEQLFFRACPCNARHKRAFLPATGSRHCPALLA